MVDIVPEMELAFKTFGDKWKVFHSCILHLISVPR